MAEASLRIVHCFRAPAGGLFRHVRDLVEQQHKAGHAVGIICDSITGGAYEDRLLARMTPYLALGLKRFPMRRNIAPADIAATFSVMREVRSLNPDVLHAHGAKGGAYARVIGTLLRVSGSRVARIYCPHGGSLHYDPKSLGGRVYFAAERGMEWMTDALIFVSDFEARTYAGKVGKPFRPATVVRNGLNAEEFVPVAPAAGAADFLFVGTLRDLKGPDVFIEALAMLRDRRGRAPSAVIVGDGDEKPRYEAMVRDRCLAETTRFHPAMPVREAFALGRVMVVPSRAESMPYIVLETIAAGLPLIATDVGGIPEIFAGQSSRLVPPGDAAALADAMAEALDRPDQAAADAFALQSHIRPLFSVEAMAAAVEGVYRTVTLPSV